MSNTQLTDEKVAQSILDHIILGVAHEINNPNAFVRLNMSNLKKLINLLRPCLEEYAENHPDAKFGPYNLDEIRSKILSLLDTTLSATVRIIAVADKLKQCTSFALTESVPINMQELMSHLIENHRFLIEKWAKLTFNTEASDQFMIHGHRLQLEQALSIMITNACDAIADRFKTNESLLGELIIWIESTDNKVSVHFKDNGCGIDESIRHKIFTPYFTTKPQGIGDGMGLPLCLAVVERHKGKVDFKSKVGAGTEFIVELAKNSH